MAQSQPIRGNGSGSTHGADPHGSASEIPDKLYFRIGEVARLCEIPAYVLRFWESEFPQLKPNKGGTGQRLYRRRDVEMALRVKTLLKDEGYTIPGARQVLKTEFRQKEPLLPLPGAGLPDAKKLQTLRRELEAIAAILSHPVGRAPAAQTVHPIRAPRRVAPRTPAPVAPGILAQPSPAARRIQTPEFPFDSDAG
jgi:DNA-binding transcriptional MerR regulator